MDKMNLSVDELGIVIEGITSCPGLDDIHSEDGDCIDLSRRLTLLLSQRGIFTERQWGLGHVSLRYPRASDYVCIDSTYLQFFEEGAIDIMPRILIATIPMAVELFQKSIGVIRPKVKIRTKIKGVEDIDRFVNGLYVNTLPYVE